MAKDFFTTIHNPFFENTNELVKILVDPWYWFGYRECVSRKGNPLLIIEGYSFFQKSKTGRKTKWVCSTHHSKGCKATVLRIDSDVVPVNIIHNH
ncbi:hypothetical protein ABMA27_001364 [Loxostege sticticalis]|uniref:FLYWCH-type domain-containing protein n=1 Tax=Loxostege sticticalis TaxID=481309 RepID=A0ABR3HY82_LOXSC